MRATINELPKNFMGTVSTREKFEEKQLELAKGVWATMKANDSEACRHCHSFESMDLEGQDRSARKKHTLKRKLERGETCIDCQKGVAHHLPRNYLELE